MSDETDLSENFEPTEQMIDQQQRAEQRADRVENEREADHDGSVETEHFDVQEALSSL